ncbi:hypothetical protein [Leeuwenhoekiella marinoflava]|uniref:hypothetical protein n=1 Tax=Leeuwenhoekiella marinoflava TaxID=988 RepID=UPI0030021F4D
MMKTNKINKQKLKCLSKIANSPCGLKKEQNARYTFRTSTIPFDDHTAYLSMATALLEVCVLALDGQGSFYSKTLSNQSLDTSVKLVLEMAIEMMPHDDMFKYQQILAILEEDTEGTHFPEKLKKLLKSNADEKEENA